MPPESLRGIARYLRRTPLHPQWLLGSKDSVAHWVAQAANGRVLDVGCADRWIERWLPRGTDYVGLDYLATGKYLYAAKPDVFADASQLPLANASVDTVVMLEVIEHLRMHQKTLMEVARVLRPGGRVLVSMPFLYPLHDAPHDYQRLTIHGLIRDVAAAGLRIECVTPSLGSFETAGLIASLAMGGAAATIVARRGLGLVLLPLLALGILFVNLAAWIASLLLPSWDAITAGYRLSATRP